MKSRIFFYFYEETRTVSTAAGAGAGADTDADADDAVSLEYPIYFWFLFLVSSSLLLWSLTTTGTLAPHLSLATTVSFGISSNLSTTTTTASWETPSPRLGRKLKNTVQADGMAQTCETLTAQFLKNWTRCCVNWKLQLRLKLGWHWCSYRGGRQA